jgi:hypothetical protein
VREVESQQGRRTDKLGEGAHTKLSRTAAAREAGLSDRQRKTALRLAVMPPAVPRARATLNPSGGGCGLWHERKAAPVRYVALPRMSALFTQGRR